MAEPVKVLRFVAVSDGMEVDRLELHADGTITASNPARMAEAVLASRVRYEEETLREAFDFLAEHGWSNGNTMIALPLPQ